MLQGSGETDLGRMLASLDVSRRPGTWVYASVADWQTASALPGVAAVVAEAEGVTAVVPAASAEASGLEASFSAAWLSLEIHSSLEAVGLTAAVSTALAEEGISCNVLAGTFHDHLLVPVDQADDAIAVLERLRDLA